jgi:hypothetical protein
MPSVTESYTARKPVKCSPFYLDEGVGMASKHEKQGIGSVSKFFGEVANHTTHAAGRVGHLSLQLPRSSCGL